MNARTENTGFILGHSRPSPDWRAGIRRSSVMAFLLPAALARTIDLRAEFCRFGLGKSEEFNCLAVFVIVGRVDDLLRLLGGNPAVFSHCAEQVSDDRLRGRHFGQ